MDQTQNIPCQMPSLLEVLENSIMLQGPPDPGAFPSKDNSKSQIFLSIDFKKFKPRDAIFMKELLSGKNQTEAAIAAGFSEKSAAALGSRKAEELREDIAELMDRKGLSDENLLDILSELLKAENEIYDPQHKTWKTRPDYSARSQGLKLAFQLKGKLNQNVAAMPSRITLLTGGADLPENKPIPIEGEVVSDGGSDSQP